MTKEGTTHFHNPLTREWALHCVDDSRSVAELGDLVPVLRILRRAHQDLVLFVCDTEFQEILGGVALKSVLSANAEDTPKLPLAALTSTSASKAAPRTRRMMTPKNDSTEQQDAARRQDKHTVTVSADGSVRCWVLVVSWVATHPALRARRQQMASPSNCTFSSVCVAKRQAVGDE